MHMMSEGLFFQNVSRKRKFYLLSIAACLVLTVLLMLWMSH